MTSKPAAKPAASAQKSGEWWIGGVAAMAAAACTHPLDLLKVRMQTATTKASLVGTVVGMVRNEGLLAFYAGLSASLLRQATYSTARFGVYDAVKARLVDENGKISPARGLLAGILGGCAGGMVGTPADLVNIRMQNDGKLPLEQRRGYRNVFDGLIKIAKDEGPTALFRGMGPNVQRAILMTASQVTSYDQIKQGLLSTPYFKDNIVTHFSSSLLAGLIATTVTSPIDVIKTRIMTAKGVAYKSSADAAVKIFKAEGFSAFFKGWIPSYSRLGPHTMLTFIFYEQIKKFITQL
ncbi:Mitochondrial dicarboxylate transporter [Quaeritorhiza haematococci]|nr:Mitochondrial dicarboxylate transporter [Quaeritorhiza haematococci]